MSIFLCLKQGRTCAPAMADDVVYDHIVKLIEKVIIYKAQEEVSMLLGVPDEITKLEEKMEGLKAFLADAERRRVTDKSVQRWVRKIEKAIYDATDILDLCQLEADKRRESKGGSGKEKVHGCFQSLPFCLKHPVLAHKIGKRIKKLNRRLGGIYKEADRFKFNIGIGYNSELRMLNTSERSSQMDKLVNLLHGGSVKEDAYGAVEFDGMQRVPLLFRSRPKFMELNSHLRDKLKWNGSEDEVILEGLLDVGSNGRLVKNLVPIGGEDDWEDYIAMVMVSDVKSLAVYVRKVSRDLGCMHAPSSHASVPELGDVGYTSLEIHDSQVEHDDLLRRDVGIASFIGPDALCGHDGSPHDEDTNCQREHDALVINVVATSLMASPAPVCDNFESAALVDILMSGVENDPAA